MESAFLRMRDVPSSLIFCSSCTLMLPGICYIHFSNPFLISPRASITTKIVVAFIPHILPTSISRSLYFESFSVTLTEVFFSVGMDILMSRQLFSCLFLISTLKLERYVSAPKCQFSPAGQSLIRPFLEPFEYNLGQQSSIKRLFQPTVGPILALGPNQP